VLTHTWPWPPPGAGGLAASSIARPAAGDGLTAGRAVGLGLAFFGVGFALGEAAGDPAGEGDAAFSAGVGDAAGDSLSVGD
jgi:hypothetical protein